jgi:hypothetical protein
MQFGVAEYARTEQALGEQVLKLLVQSSTQSVLLHIQVM